MDITKALLFAERYHDVLDKLANLEIEGKIDTVEYNDTLILLNEIDNIISKYLFGNGLDYELWCNQIDSIEHIDQTPEELKNPFLVAITNEGFEYQKLKESLLYYYYSNNLVPKVDLYPEFYQVDKKGRIVIDQKTYNAAMEELNQQYIEENWCNIFLKNMIYNKFMDILLDDINNEKNEERKKRLIAIKYRLIGMSFNLFNKFKQNKKDFTSTDVIDSLIRQKNTTNAPTYDEYYLDTLVDILDKDITNFAKFCADCDDKKESIEFINLYTKYIEAVISSNYDTYLTKQLRRNLETIIDLLSYDEHKIYLENILNNIVNKKTKYKMKTISQKEKGSIKRPS